MHTQTMLLLFTHASVFAVLLVWCLYQLKTKQIFEARKRITNINVVNMISTIDTEHTLQNF